MSYNQWPSTSTLMEWLRDIENKKPVNLLNLTLWNSTPELLEKSINFARSIIEIQDKIINIIKHTRKTLLFHEGTAWVKKEGNSFTSRNYGKLRWGRGLWACKSLFVKQTPVSGWY